MILISGTIPMALAAGPMLTAAVATPLPLLLALISPLA